MPVVNFTLGTQRITSMRQKSCGSTSAVNQSLESLVQGANRCKYFNQPVTSQLQPERTIPNLVEDRNLLVSRSDEAPVVKYAAAETQTDFRENEAQTDPWDPPSRFQGSTAPEILSLKKWTYGNGLPVSVLEVQHIAKTRRYRKLDAALSPSTGKKVLSKRRQAFHEQVTNEWDYVVSKINQKQTEKLKLMKCALSEEMRKNSERSDRLLKNIWTKKKAETSRYCWKLQEKLKKQIRDLEQKEMFLKGKISKTTKEPVKEENNNIMPQHTINDKQKLLDQVDALFSSFYLCDVRGLSEIEKWLEEDQNMILKNEICMPKPTFVDTPMHRLTEKAYQDLLVDKQTKLPPKVYHDDYCKEEKPLPSIQQKGFERVDFGFDYIDPVTLLQKTLRGRAYQKTILEMVDQHEAAIAVLLSQQAEKNNPTSSKCDLTIVDKDK